MKRFIPGLSIVCAMTALTFAGPNDSNWVQMLRKGDTALADWIPKIQGYAAGQNPNRSFTYAEAGDGSPRLEVTDTVTWSNNYGYGHLFYKTPFADYILRAQFHFPSKTSYAVANGNWTIQNNGLMLHCQSPASMTVSQQYPNSIEDQLLGYWSQAAANPPSSRSSNVCVPGMTIYYNNGAPGTSGSGWYSDGTGHHCTNAKLHSLLYDSVATAVKGANSTNSTWAGANIWQYAMAKVMDSTSMAFWVRSRPDTAWDSVMAFTRIRSGNAASGTAANNPNPAGTAPMTSGYISIQMEGTSTEFAKIEILNLVGCMNPADTSYRTFFVKDSSTTKCSGVTTEISGSQRRAQGIFLLSGNRIQATSEILNVEVYDLQGIHVASLRGEGKSFMDIANLKPGLYSLRVQTRKGSAQAVYTKM